MSQQQIQKRIAEMKAMAKETWLSPERFFCDGCGLGFRYEDALNRHQRQCLDLKYN